MTARKVETTLVNFRASSRGANFTGGRSPPLHPYILSEVLWRAFLSGGAGYDCP
jgi:hypothetical protein